MPGMSDYFNDDAFYGFHTADIPNVTRFFSKNLNSTLNSTGTKNVVLIYPRSDLMLKNPFKVNDSIIESPLQHYIETKQITVRTNKRKNLIVAEILDQSEAQSIISDILKIDKIGNWEVDSRLPNQDISRSGVISPVSEEVKPEDLIEVIKPWNTSFNLGASEASQTKVIGAERLQKKVGNEWIDSTSLKITFQGNSLPEGIFIFQSSYRVRPYVRPPLQCYNCQRPGHTAGSCPSKQRCLLCAGEHNRKDCRKSESEFKCANCSGAHRANSDECPFYKVAKKIEKVRATKNESYPQARKTVLESLGRGPGAGSMSSPGSPARIGPNSRSAPATQTAYRDAVAPRPSNPHTTPKDAQIQTECGSGYFTEGQFFQELQTCLLEILDVLKPEDKGEQNSKTVEQAIQKSFLRNKSTEKKQEKHDDKVSPQQNMNLNPETHAHNLTEEMNDESFYSDSNDSQFTTEGATSSQPVKRKNSSSKESTPSKGKKKSRKKK